MGRENRFYSVGVFGGFSLSVYSYAAPTSSTYKYSITKYFLDFQFIFMSKLQKFCGFKVIEYLTSLNLITSGLELEAPRLISVNIPTSDRNQIQIEVNDKQIRGKTLGTSCREISGLCKSVPQKLIPRLKLSTMMRAIVNATAEKVEPFKVFLIHSTAR